MGFFDYLGAHPVWALAYLLILCFTAIIVAGIRRDHTDAFRLINNVLGSKAGAPNITIPVDAEKPGPRPLNG